MLTMAWYLLKVIICSGILYGYYWLFLRNKAFHHYNRFYLLSATSLSLLIPLLKINWWQQNEKAANDVVKVLQVVASGNEYIDNAVVQTSTQGWRIEQLYPGLYILVSLFLLIMFIRTLYFIYSLLKKFRAEKIENILLVNTTHKNTPFCFLHYIFWNASIDIATPEGKQIFKHELAHIRERHTYDKLFLNSLLIFYWCNPFFWLIRKELNMIHEFVADKKAVENGDTAAFAAMILQATYPKHHFNLINNLYFSPIKRRLLMLTKNKSPRANYAVRILVLPVVIFVFAAFSLENKKAGKLPVYHGKKITVIIDAAEGGYELGWHSSNGINEKGINLAIAKKIKEVNSNENIEIVLSRMVDTHVDYIQREKIAIESNADLFITISLAQNVNNNKERGWDICIPYDTNKYYSESKSLGSILFTRFEQGYEIPPYQNTLLKRAWVKTYNQCPVIMIQPGHITNLSDFNYFNNTDNQRKIAVNILRGIEQYLSSKNSFITSIQKDTIIPKQQVSGNPKNTDKEITNNVIYASVTSGNMNVLYIGMPNPITVTADIAPEDLLISISDGSISGSNGKYNVTVSHPGIVKINLYKKGDTGLLHSFNFKVKTFPDPQTLLPNKELDVQYKIIKVDTVEVTVKNKVKLTANKIAIDKENKEKVLPVPNMIFTKVEIEPSFPGGKEAWRNYLEKNIIADLPIKEGWKPGTYTIFVQFIVHTDGTISDVTTTNFKDSKTARHCIDLIKNGPKWNPALQNGNVVNAYKRQPFTFVVEQEITKNP